MLDAKLETLLAVSEYQNFTRAAEALSLTQPAVSHHIALLEQQLGVTLFVRGRGALKLTPEGEIAVRYARRFKALSAKLREELAGADRRATRLRIGITHTSESNLTTEALAKCSCTDNRLTMTILTDTIKNLYDMLDSYEIDLAIVEGGQHREGMRSLMLDTDYLVCAMSNENPLSRNAMVTLNELKRERMILRLPSSATRALEVDNIATIKDLVRKNLGVSILPRSACMDELRKGKIAALPIENLSMVRETRLIYKDDFTHMDILQEITKTYQETAKAYH